MFSLRLQNYKSFLDAEVQLSKINILIGPNNSGKSAFLKFLLMLKQSLIIDSSKLDYNLTGRLVDLGRFEDIVYFGEKDRKLNFTFRWKENKLIDSNSLQNLIFSDAMTFEINPNLTCSNYTLEWNGNVHTINYDYNSTLSKINHGFLRFKQLLNEGEQQLIVNQEVLSEKGFMLVFSTVLLTLLVTFKYINPLHSSPERTYNKRDNQGIKDIRDLNDVIYFLADSSIEKEKKEALVSKLNEMVRFLGIAKELKLMQAENIPAMQLWVKIGDNEFWNNITDVGYGLSMQLPMLLQSLISEVEGGAWLLFEQPEIHIYPRLQAKFIEAITTLGPNNNYIIETHSDIMVKKLQAMVKEGKLKAEDVAIHYFDRKSEQTTVTRHSVLADGTLDIPLPEDFYDNSTDLILELLK